MANFSKGDVTGFDIIFGVRVSSHFARVETYGCVLVSPSSAGLVDWHTGRIKQHNRFDNGESLVHSSSLRSPHCSGPTCLRSWQCRRPQVACPSFKVAKSTGHYWRDYCLFHPRLFAFEYVCLCLYLLATVVNTNTNVLLSSPAVNATLPFTMSPEYIAAQRAYMRYHNMNPIYGLSSKYVTLEEVSTFRYLYQQLTRFLSLRFTGRPELLIHRKPFVATLLTLLDGATYTAHIHLSSTRRQSAVLSFRWYTREACVGDSQ
jgi:hypothetical protein